MDATIATIGSVLCNEGHGRSRKESNCKSMLCSRCSGQRQQKQPAGCFRAVLAAQNRFLQESGSKCAHQATSTKGPKIRAYVPLYTVPGLQVGFSPALSTGWLLSKNNSPQHVTISKQPACALSTITYLHHKAKKKTWRHTRIISLHPFAALPEGGTMRV